MERTGTLTAHAQIWCLRGRQRINSSSPRVGTSVCVTPSVEAGVCLGSPLLPHPQEALSQPTCPAPWDAEAGEAPAAGPGPAHGEHRGCLTGAVPSLPVSSCRALSVGTSFFQARGIKAPPSLATFHLGALNKWPPPLRGSILHV